MLLAPEILYKIFSNLPYSEVYKLRSICKSWKQLCEYHLYLAIKSSHQKIYVKIGEKGNTTLIDMIPHSYDAENQVIEFKKASEEEDEDDVFVDMNKSNRRMQIIFSEWYERSTVDLQLIQNLSLIERAQVLFHLKYNPSLEQVYEFPAPLFKRKNELHYVGDKGMILSFSYLYPPNHDALENKPIDFQGIEDTSQTLFDQALEDPSDQSIDKIRLRIQSVHVHLTWLLSGINPDISPLPIYVKRYQKLAKLLSSNGVHKDVCAYSEPVLDYVLHQEDDIVSQISQLNGYSRREQLRFKLQSIGIDPRVIWKYNLAKTFILKDSSGMALDDVAKKIQISEQEWVIKKLDLIRQLRNSS